MSDLDRVLAESDPLHRWNLEGGTFDEALAELRAEVGSAPDTTLVPSAPPAETTGPRWFTLRRLAVGAALAAAIAIAMVLIPRGPGDDDTRTAYAAEAIKVAEANRRLLATEPGWRVEYAQFESPTYGEVQFGDEKGLEGGGDYLSTNWYPPEDLKMRTRPEGQPVEIGGEEGYFYPASSSGEFYAVLPPLNGSFLLINGSAKSAEEFRKRLESMESVDVEAWLGAMPDSVVLPQDQASATEKLLEGVPLPPDFDLSTIESKGLPEDEYQFAAYVLRGVYCGWLDRWWFAQKAGDAAVAEDAIDQLQAAPRWPALAEDPKRNPLVDDFREYADLVERGYANKQQYDQMENCIEYP